MGRGWRACRFPRRGGPDWCSRVLGWWVLRTRVHSASVGTAESCGTAMSVAGAVLFPCATPRKTAPTDASCSLAPAPPPRLLGCREQAATSSPIETLANTSPDVLHTTISARVATDLEAEVGRSRRGVRPISRRVATDLEPEVDRSRCGVRPISRESLAGAAEHHRGRTTESERKRGASWGASPGVRLPESCAHAVFSPALPRRGTR